MPRLRKKHTNLEDEEDATWGNPNEIQIDIGAKYHPSANSWQSGAFYNGSLHGLIVCAIALLILFALGIIAAVIVI